MWLISCHLGGNEPSNIGRWEQAVEAYSALMTDPIVSSSRWTVDMIGNRMDLAREQLSEDVFQAAEQRGLEGDLFTVLGRLAHEIDTFGGGFEGNAVDSKYLRP